MKKPIFAAMILMALLARPGRGTAGPAPTCDLTVVVTGLRNATGQVMIGLYQDPATFLKTPLRGEIAAIKGDRVEVLLRKVPYGVYAVAVYHDENRNRKLDTNFIGMPKEGAAVSNNPKSRMGPPRWEDAKFTIGSPVMLQTIQLIYF